MLSWWLICWYLFNIFLVTFVWIEIENPNRRNKYWIYMCMCIGHQMTVICLIMVLCCTHLLRMSKKCKNMILKLIVQLKTPFFSNLSCEFIYLFNALIRIAFFIATRVFFWLHFGFFRLTFIRLVTAVGSQLRIAQWFKYTTTWIAVLYAPEGQWFDFHWLQSESQSVLSGIVAFGNSYQNGSWEEENIKPFMRKRPSQYRIKIYLRLSLYALPKPYRFILD